MADKKAPELRFKGFSDDWEQRKLGELTKVKTGKAFSSADFNDEGEYLVVTNKNIQDNLNGITSVGKRIDISEEAVLNDFLLSGNNILITMDGVNIGKTGKYSDEKAVLAQRVGRLKSEQLEFIYQVTNNNNFLTEMNKLSVGNAIKHISLKQISEYSFGAPVTEEEQKKVGDLFKFLDKTITLHQRKIDTLVKLKQGLLQQMFPTHKVKIPNLRFANFNFDWELCELGEIVQITMGQSPNGKNYTKNPKDHILVQGNADMKNGRVIPRVWTTQVTKKAKPEDIIVSVRAPVGDVGITDYPVVLGRGVAGIKGSAFIFQTLLRMKEIGYWIRYSTGSTFESINSADLKESVIQIPNLEEQSKIGVFFTNFDNTFVLQQKKIDKLKKIKKAYLQKMFI